MARWIKFEETVESEGNRWSKPHVSTPSLAGWMQLRKFFRSGLILLDVEAKDMGKICNIVAAALAATSEGIAAASQATTERVFTSRSFSIFDRSRSNRQDERVVDVEAPTSA